MIDLQNIERKVRSIMFFEDTEKKKTLLPTFLKTKKKKKTKERTISIYDLLEGH